MVLDPDAPVNLTLLNLGSPEGSFLLTGEPENCVGDKTELGIFPPEISR
jgi:hypothetical protein